MKTKQTGFTLIELMVTLAVAIVVLAIGVPMYDNMVANNRLVAQLNNLVTAINLTKNEAISKNLSAAICPDSDTNPSTQACGSATDWENGWFVFEDDDADGVKDSSERTVKIWNEAVRGTDIVVVDNSSSAISVLRFNSRGEMIVPSGTSFPVSFRFAQVDSNSKIATTSQPRCLYVNVIGQIRSEKMTGVSKGDTASSVTCPTIP